MPSHSTQCEFSFEPAQLFDLVADVERYPDFLPGCFAARVIMRKDNVYCSDQILGFGTFRKRFATKTVLERPERILVTSSDRLFARFELTWRFYPLPDNGCRVFLLADVELRTRLVQSLFDRTIHRTVGSVMSAFKARADNLYCHRLETRETGSDGAAGQGDF